MYNFLLKVIFSWVFFKTILIFIATDKLNLVLLKGSNNLVKMAIFNNPVLI